MNGWEDLLSLGTCVRNLITFERTNDNTPELFTAILWKGDCYNRAKLFRYYLNKLDINNTLELCSVINNTRLGVIHARNRVMLGSDCFIVDTTINELGSVIVMSCLVTSDYCAII